MQSQLENLYRRSGITKESCFHAARRLDSHNNLSLWALSILAFSLIVISLLLQIYSDNGFIVENKKFLDFSMTAMSILALLISVVVAKSNFSLKADNFRRQAMEINELRISFRHLIDKDDENGNKENLYNEKSSEYSGILSRNLVHDQIDFYISNTTGIEHKYYFAKLVITEFLGYILIILLSLSLLFWAGHGAYKVINPVSSVVQASS
ncbi:SLATT domain-containing protein [Vibrio cholerae]|nr:SLATT domain-containing protein [Vibrio cholerae]EIC2299082.1 SLATT domain-containing protein [Vibrio cholerae]EJL6467558.1 SLATT domain-containing protein [Vibrio cholerae]EJL6912680.1 SLATT domain-containing protein [Vibrio cholerae]EKF9821336.1 SLATT domain-containing protein [Vibrio cholerae]EMC4027282.1 SLATT domain-containing protein [Vibrio cholerae]